MEAVTTVISLITAGGPTAIIVILCLVIGYLVWERTKLMKLLQRYQTLLNDNRSQYADSIVEIINRYHSGNVELIQALNEIRIVLATMQKNNVL